ncbi:MAG: ABC transporter ATP-binding protein [Anaerorhabdus sp.]
MENDQIRNFTLKEQFSLLKRLLSYTLSYKMLLVFVFILVILATLTDVIYPLILQEIVDKAFPQSGVNFEVLYKLTILYAIDMSLNSIIRYAQVYNFNKLGFKISKDLRKALFEKLQSQGMRYYDKTAVGSIVSRVTNDTEAIQDMLNQVLSVMISSVLLLIGISVVLFNLNVTMAFICISFLPIMIGIIYTYQKHSTKYYMIAREKLSQLNTKIAESISGMNIIQIFTQQKRFKEEFDVTNTEYYSASMKNIHLSGLLLSSAIHFLTSLCLILIFTYAGFQSFNNLISAGLMVAFLEYIYRFFEPMFQIMDRLAIYQQALVASHRIFLVLDHTEVNPIQNVTKNHIVNNAKIEFKNVSFSYDGKNKVLNNISFTVNPNETIALVGHTGSGKSSIINVMMRFYEFFEGDILIDGVSIKEYPIKELRKNIGLVLQDPFLYYGSINDNVRLKNLDITDDQIKDSCRFVKADSFIEPLSDGYNHKVIERGASFSMGQKQLLAFARCIVTNPKILVLDEATANINSETEQLIQEGLVKIRQGRTTIAIAHRLSTIKDANQILVLDKGSIIERGTHEELIDLKGSYYAMYKLQQSEEKVKKIS